MKTRIISGLIMVPIVLAALLLGGWVLWGACLLISLVAVREFYMGFKELGVRPGYTIGYCSVIGLYMMDLIFMGFGFMLTGVWAFGTILAGLLYLFWNFEDRKLADSMATITGAFYVGFFLHHLVLVDQIGRDLGTAGGTMIYLNDYLSINVPLFVVFITAFGTDVMAYFTGYALGHHKLCPKISPKKTIEGALGGVLGSMILCAGFALLCTPDLFGPLTLLGVLGGVISQFGDLTASIFKRKMGIKDYGKLIPGHGGILDRFDSVMFTAPMTAYFFLAYQLVM